MPSEKILIIQLMHHGDVLLATAAAHALKQVRPDCEVDMLVYRGMEDVVADNPLIGRVFTIGRDWKRRGVWYRVGREYALLRDIRAQGYGMVLNYSDRWRAGFAAACSGAPLRVAYARAHAGGTVWRRLHTSVLTPPPGLHTVEKNLRLLPPQYLPGIGVPPRVVMAVSEAARASLRFKLEQQGWTGQDYVLLHPGSRWFFKCWPPENMAQIVRKLLDDGRAVVLTAAPDPREQAMLAAILQDVGVFENAPLFVLDGTLNLRELAAAIEGAQLFIGVDSVPMHIAAALDKPQVALFGPTRLENWRPYSDRATVIWAGDYGELPHPENVDTEDGRTLLAAIPPEAVWQAVKEQL
ncbi:MAG: putative lipopolysaccharide heptosyltransferase III, partial [Neisseria sp.]|nr:putative lipopolysaccharide heptosyltransferase III [Neisseria sp.]